MTAALPPIPPKRYFTIGEVSELCAVKPYVLRYWEQEFSQLRPMKRRGNRRYYQHHEVLLVRRIRELLYEQRFTISGARDRLAESAGAASQAGVERYGPPPGLSGFDLEEGAPWDAAAEPWTAASSNGTGAAGATGTGAAAPEHGVAGGAGSQALDLRRELLAIRRLLGD